MVFIIGSAESRFSPRTFSSVHSKRARSGWPSLNPNAQKSTDRTPKEDNMEADGKERDGEGAGAVSGINSRQDKNKTALTTLDDRDKTILKRVGPQQKYHSPWLMLVTF